MSVTTLVYRCPGQHFAHAGQTYDYAQAATEEDLERRLADGWHLSLADAVDAATAVTGVGSAKNAKQVPESDDDAPPTRAELEEMAEGLGIKFDGRTSDAGLLRRIEEAVAEQV